MNKVALLIFVSFLSVLSQEFIPFDIREEDDGNGVEFRQNTIEFRNYLS